MLSLFILFVELIGSTISLVWILAMLGFADESHRSSKASCVGKLCVVCSVFLAFLPLAVTGWLGWSYYFSKTWEQVPLGWWLHVIVALVCFPIAWMLVRVYDASYKEI